MAALSLAGQPDGVGVLEQLYGHWRLTAGGRSDQCPWRSSTRHPNLEVRDDGRASDVGRLLRFEWDGTASPGLLELEVDDDTTLQGAWCVSPATFLAEIRAKAGRVLVPRL